MLVRGYRQWLREERRKAQIATDFFTKLAEEHRRSRYRPAPPKPKRSTIADKCADYDWRSRMILKDGGSGFAPIFANILAVLREHPELSGIVGWLPRTRRIVLKGRLPHDWSPDFEMRFFTRDDLTAVHEFLEGEVGLMPLPRSDIYWAIRKVARENQLTEDIHDG